MSSVVAVARDVALDPRAGGRRVRARPTAGTLNPGVGSPRQRAGWAFASADMLIAAVVVHGWGWWLLAVVIAPDVPLFFGAGTGLAHGQLHPRAVPAYNLTHRLAGPLASIGVGVAAAIAGHGFGVLVVGLLWGTHVAFDRACGYGLRTSTGFRR